MKTTRERRSGVLMHLSSLPGKYGIGSFGKEAFRFIDRLKAGGFSIWQTLPFCMPDLYGSPYSSYSAFSGNPFLIDLDILAEQKLLNEYELATELQNTPWLCEFDRLQKTRIPLLLKAARRALRNCETAEAVEAFCQANPQIRDFCRFMALKSCNDNLPWNEWKNTEYDPVEASLWEFIQYEFCRQWTRVKEYAHENGILLVGDIPIYVAYDSSDVYANRDTGIFDLYSDGRCKNVAGVPPTSLPRRVSFGAIPSTTGRQ